MSGSFDPYHKWLGIPSQEQPPNHYRLLALPLFESDPEVIESAADQRMGHVRTYQAGRYSAQSQQILNELAAARICLLSPEKKAAYDQQLQSQLSPPPAAPPAMPAIPTGQHILPSPPPPILGAAPAPPRASGGYVVVPPPTATAVSAGVVDDGQGGDEDHAPPKPAESPTAAPRVETKRTLRLAKKSSPMVAVALAAILLLSVVAAAVVLRKDPTLSERPSGSRGNTTAPVTTIDPTLSTPRTTPDETAGHGSLVEDLAGQLTSPKPPTEPAPPTTPSEDQAEDPQADPPVDVPESDPADAPDPGQVGDEPVAMPADPVEEPPTTGQTTPGENTGGTTVGPSLADLLEEAEDTDQGSEETGGRAADPAETGTDSPEDPDDAKPSRKARVPSRPALLKAAAHLQPILKTGTVTELLDEAQKSDRSISEVYVLLEQSRQKAIAQRDVAHAFQAVDILGARFVGDVATLARKTCLGLQQVSQGASEQRTVALESLQLSQEAQQDGEAELAKFLAEFAGVMARASGDQQVLDSVTAHFDQLPE